MSTVTPRLEPLRTTQRLRSLTDAQLDELQEATLRILEEVGVRRGEWFISPFGFRA